MTESMEASLPRENGRVFSSWKEIANYLGKGVRTVQRWEKTLGLPVSRPNGQASNVVLASEDALRRWVAANTPQASDAASEPRDELLAEMDRISAKLAELEEKQARLEQAFYTLMAGAEAKQEGSVTAMNDGVRAKNEQFPRAS